MKPSSVSIQKVMAEAMMHGLPPYNQCCTECRHAQAWLLARGSLKTVDGVVTQKELVN